MFSFSKLCKNNLGIFLKTAYFASKLSRETPCIDVNCSKIKVPQFLCCDYVCMYVFVYAPSQQPTLF